MHASQLRPLLLRDPVWSLFALADLHPSAAPHCQWHASDDAVLLLYSAFRPPVLFALGNVEPLLHEINAPQISLQVQPETLKQLAPRYRVDHLRTMWRMVLAQPLAAPATTVRLTSQHLDELLALHSDGHATGEAPEFFSPSMLATGIFHGVRVNGQLVAAAGTYMVVPEEGVAALGHVYTRRDQRGRGYAGQATAAVAAEAAAQGCRWIGLNVEQHNTAAVRTYEKLGFQRHCAFHEGTASLVTELQL